MNRTRFFNKAIVTRKEYSVSWKAINDSGKLISKTRVYSSKSNLNTKIVSLRSTLDGEKGEEIITINLDIEKKVKELDFIDNNLSNFSINFDPIYYRLSSSDRKRPDIISFNNYETVKYWWLTCLVNGIEDPFFETVIGKVMIIPDIQDIFSFYRNHAVR